MKIADHLDWNRHAIALCCSTCGDVLAKAGSRPNLESEPMWSPAAPDVEEPSDPADPISVIEVIPLNGSVAPSRDQSGWIITCTSKPATQHKITRIHLQRALHGEELPRDDNGIGWITLPT